MVVWRATSQRRCAPSVVCVAMWLFVAMNLASRSVGPPFDLFLLAPASVVAARTTAQRGVIRTVLWLLAAAYSSGLALALVPLEVSDSFGGYRIFGTIAYAGVGLLWAALGVLVLVHRRKPRPAAR